MRVRPGVSRPLDQRRVTPEQLWRKTIYLCDDANRLISQRARSAFELHGKTAHANMVLYFDLCNRPEQDTG